MLPLDGALADSQIAELLGAIRRATRTAMAALGGQQTSDRPSEIARCFTAVGLEAVGPDLFRAPGWTPQSPPVYLAYSEADGDVAIVRPLGWRDTATDPELPRRLLLETGSLPTGGYAFARVDDEDLAVFVDHLATQSLDESELRKSLYSARLAGVRLGVDDASTAGLVPCVEPSRHVVETVHDWLLRRPTGWSRSARGRDAAPAWTREGEAPTVVHFDRDRGVLVLARGLRSFVGTFPLDAAERLLRTNLGLLEGAIAVLRDGGQGVLVLLRRLCYEDLDLAELERAVSFIERVRFSWAREGRSALELLGILERAERPAETDSAPAPLLRESRLPETIGLGSLESGEPFELPVSDFLTHAFVCGCSGSGKTIVCKNLIEELALAGVPSVVVDLKGDLSSLACVPDDPAPDIIARYLARLHGRLTDPLREQIARAAQRAADLYGEAGRDADDLRRMTERVAWRIFTPRSDHGIQLSLSPLGRFELGTLGQGDSIIGNRAVHELVDANLHSLVDYLQLSEVDAETLVAALIELLETAHRQGLFLQGIEGIETLVRLLFEVGEHAERINFLPTDQAIDPRDAQRYARIMNARLGGTFRYWFDGEALSIDDLLVAGEGRVPVNIINLSLLSSIRDQAYAIAQINAQIIEWMRRQPGASRPRLLYCIDEIAQEGGRGAVLPPHPYSPITKPGLTVLLRQGRAFGVSCLLATQNAKDIDYKALGQSDTWVIGRLKTTADLDRLALGLEAAAEMGGGGELGEPIGDVARRSAGLAPGQFIAKTRTRGVATFRQRWIRSLHERLTPEMVQGYVRIEELAVDRVIESARESWNRGETARAVATLDDAIERHPHYSRRAEARLVLCEWLFRTSQWSRAADHAAALRETVRSRAGFELVHYYEGLALKEVNRLDDARVALERFVASAAAQESELGQRCREHLAELYIAQDDYESLERAAEAEPSRPGRSRLLAFCRAMVGALASWPALRGKTGETTVVEDADPETGELRLARKRERSVHSYAAEIQRRLADLPLSAPPVKTVSAEERRSLDAVASRIALDQEARCEREAQLAELLNEAEAHIDEEDWAAASEAIDAARKLVHSTGLPSHDLERVISLYRGATAAGRRSLGGWLLQLDPFRFELEVAMLFRCMGYDAQATQPSGDGGVDVFATFRNRRYVIQCKRYRHPVGPGAIRELATAVRDFDADEAIFVTTSRFTDGCQEEASRHDIQLIDLDGLLELYAARTRRSRAGGSAAEPAPDAPPPNAAVREQVLDALAGPEPLTAREVARAAQIPFGDCQRALRALVSEGRVAKSGRARGTRYARRSG